MRRVLLLVLLIGAVVAGCSPADEADVRRTNALAQDPLFDALAQEWEPTSDMRLRPGQPAPATPFNSVLQIYRVSDAPDIETLTWIAQTMTDSGWSDLFANCEARGVSGRRLDDFGPVAASVQLYAGDGEPQAIVELTATMVEEGITELTPRNLGTPCLDTD